MQAMMSCIYPGHTPPHIPLFPFVVMDRTKSGARPSLSRSHFSCLPTLNKTSPPAVCSSLTHLFSYLLSSKQSLSLSSHTPFHPTFIAWRVYVYKTQGPFLPESLRRNVFARTRSMIPRTLSFNPSNKDVIPTTTPAGATRPTGPIGAAGSIRNETKIDIPSVDATSQQQPPMASIPSDHSRSVAAQSFAAVPCDRKSPSPTAGVDGSISSGQGQAPSPAISRLIAMK
ncbi:MAG: hypothetical protein JOS17DRAFT_320182 [Linnemannia elongata]|nr:MAG: hypothetical protein JOS17DRAFT_320182 [Linnemannia elongata]